ncbi:hypothetical protein OROHE_016626 [Orobanche hederae]
MATSWDELTTDHKIVFLLESLVQKQDELPLTPIACRLCDEIFFDNKSLVHHFQSHFHPDGTFNPSSLVRNFENEIKLFSSPSKFSISFSAPVNACNNHISKSVSSNPSKKLRLVESTVQIPSENPIKYEPSALKPNLPRKSGKSSQSIPSTAPSLGKRPRTAVKNEAEGSSPGYTMPYINQLEQPVKETRAAGDDSNHGELDLTLKL